MMTVFQFIKQTNVKRKPKKQWISNGLLASIKKKNRLNIAYLRKPSNKSRVKHTLYKNKLTTLVRNSTKQYFYDLFQRCKGNMKKHGKILMMYLATRHKMLFQMKCTQVKIIIPHVNRLFRNSILTSLI